MGYLSGKTVLVTGASSGIGRATALAFAREGARVAVCARREERLKELASELSQAGASAVHTFILDVRNRVSVEQAIAALPGEWAAIDVLVNNAGLSRGLTKVYEDDHENWEEMIDTNVKGLLYVTRAVVPGMVERGRGHVINMGSTAGYITYANGAVYCGTKAAEKAISEGLKIDLMGTPVRVTSIDPGMVETEFSEIRFRGDKERAEKVYQNITPLQPQDIADAIVWAASRPAHVNIHTVVMTTIDQANSVVFHRHS
ncbi:SDR family oxidoreductase [Edaphobacter albus]|uniref:SDR family oxidoreductase n=1 Tax=Edaphobacter sp. 4G125 TaxID=2763071 RepID=UPI0016450737|nr:SDR family oxidoreductase [Edaphobacter sp. 4G125]QNI36544.1 SDR family oxidoreductase [Edaphobacter sp. 4G125]